MGLGKCKTGLYGSLFGIGYAFTSSREQLSHSPSTPATPVLTPIPLRLRRQILGRAAHPFSDLLNSGLVDAISLFPRRRGRRVCRRTGSTASLAARGQPAGLLLFVGRRTGSPASGAARGQHAGLPPLAAATLHHHRSVTCMFQGCRSVTYTSKLFEVTFSLPQ